MATKTESEVPRSKYWVDNKAPDFPIKSGIPFFYQDSQIKSLNWNLYYPYQLLILRVRKSEDGSGITYDPTPFVFTLPIPPQDLTINMPIATTVQATLNGIVEQHGGAPFRDIVLNGTTGITPIKNNAGAKEAPTNTASAIFAGSVTAARSVANSVSNLVDLQPNLNKGLSSSDSIDDDLIPEKSTGYYQFRLLQRFIEAYTELKKKSVLTDVPGLAGVNTKDLRLGFAVYKDESIYICSGVSFQMRRAVSNPMEYLYTLQLRAWKRVKLQGNAFLNFNHQFVARKPNAITALLGRLDLARDIIEQTGSIFKSVIQDPQNRLDEIMRETSLFLKSSVSTVETIRDLPKTTQSDVVANLYRNWNLIYRQFPGLDPTPPSVFLTGRDKLFTSTGSRLGRTTQELQVSPTNITTNNKLNELFKIITPNLLPLPSNVVKGIQLEKERVKLFNRLDFEKKRDEIKEFSYDFADAIGAGGETLNLILNRNPIPSTRTPTDDEYNVLYALNEVAMILDHLAASGTIDPITPTSLEYVSGLAEQSGIAFTVPVSKFAVPFPYGHTLERLAEQYLGSANRWHEIATLNGLRAPYVDEEGFILPFVTNGDGRRLYVSDQTNLYIHQTVYISSNDQLKSRRKITNIREIYDGYIEVTVDGDSNLDEFTVPAQAVLEAFLPGTVNSQQIIYIPSDQQPQEDPRTKAIPGIDEFDPLIKVSGIDLLLTQDGDLAITPTGNVRLAYGLQNIIQKVKLALATPKGSLLQHPEYGIAVQIGESTADVSADDIIKSISKMFEGDPSFTGVKSASVSKNGPVCQITIIVGVVGVSQFVPITLNIMR